MAPRPSTSLLSRLLLSQRPQTRSYSAPLDGAIPANKQKYVPTSGTYPKGFLASGTHVGVKKSNTKNLDLALIASETPCSAAAVFTKNVFKAAPVVVDREILDRRAGAGIRAVVVNSGCANAVTGKGGMQDAYAMGKEVDRCFAGEGGVNAEDDGKGSRTFVMSTGVIGQR
jgi:glutamate N-acetyltransferase / amino-acid N-acetyltransferase